MLGNSAEISSIGQNYSSSSVSKCNIDEDPKMNVSKDCKIVESVHRSILDELIDDAILDVCFEVHRSAKLSHLLIENPEKYQKFQVKEQTKNVVCPICHYTTGAENFTRHLSRCMGISAKRKATQKIISFEEYDSDSDSEEYVPGASKKRNKEGNKNNRKHSKLQDNFVPKQYSSADFSYEHMSQEEKTSFFNKNCGVVSKRTKKMCTKTLNCAQHTDEQRRDVRNDLLKDCSDPVTNEEEVDVDTVDEDVYRFTDN